jgi:periplasmic divalent cation tolerance protein
MSEHRLVLITCGQEEEARLIARRIVADSAAAGVQIVPIESIYKWQGEVVEDHEWLLVAKTRAEKFGFIEEIVDEIHSYKVPPLLAIDISEASAPYLAWIDDVVEETT